MYYDYYLPANFKISDSSIIYRNKSNVCAETVTLSDPIAKKMEEFSIVTNFYYEYRPGINYYSTIIDSYYSKFRLMMHECSNIRAYCNSGILWSKTVDNYQVIKVSPPENYEFTFTYKKGKIASYINGKLHWTKEVIEDNIDLSKFSLLMNVPMNRKLKFGNKFIGNIHSITILKTALTQTEVAELFIDSIKANNFIATEFAIKYILPWTLIFFICFYSLNILNFFVRCFSERKLADCYVLFVYIITISFCVIYNFGNAVIKELESSSSGNFVSFYTFWLLYFCFFSFYLSVLCKIFKRPLLLILGSLYFITALLIYSLWLSTTKEWMPVVGNLFIAICIATFVLNPLLFQEDEVISDGN